MIKLKLTVTQKNTRDLYRGISGFHKGYKPPTNTAKDETGDLVTDSHRILTRCTKHFSLLFIVHVVNDVRQPEIHTAEPLAPESSAFEVELATENLKRHKSPCTDQIPAELIKSGGRTILSKIHKLINSIWNKEELHEQWKESIIVPICKKGDTKDCSNYTGISLLSTAYQILSNIPLSSLTPYAEEITGDHHCGFRRNRSTTDRIFCVRQIPGGKMDVVEK